MSDIFDLYQANGSVSKKAITASIAIAAILPITFAAPGKINPGSSFATSSSAESVVITADAARKGSLAAFLVAPFIFTKVKRRRLFSLHIVRRRKNTPSGIEDGENYSIW